MVLYEGIVQEIEPIKILKEGTTGAGKNWVLFGTRLKVDNASYGITDFVKSKLENYLKNINVNDRIQFDFELEGTFKNINKKGLIKVLEKNVAVPVSNLNTKSFGDKPGQEYWDLKDRRITRQSCLSRAIEFLKANKEITGDKEAITLDELKHVATWFENRHVYREEFEDGIVKGVAGGVVDATRNVVTKDIE